MLSVRVPKELEARLDHLAEKTQRSRSYYVKKALESYLENEEDYAAAVLAYEEHIRSGGKTYTSQEIRERHGID